MKASPHARSIARRATALAVVGLAACALVAGASAPAQAASIVHAATKKTKITTQPTSKSYYPKQTASFTVKASGTKLTYQWYAKSSSTGKWKKVTGSKSRKATLKITVGSKIEPMWFKVTVTGKNGKATSKTVKLTTLEPTTKITSQPKSDSLEPGQTASFSVKATGQSLTYQWYAKEDGGDWKKVKGSKSRKATLKITVGSKIEPMWFKVTVTGKKGAVTSKTVKLTTVATNTVITKHPTSETAAKDKTAAFTVKATADSKVSYQWYQVAPGKSSGTKLTGTTAKKATLKVKASNKLHGAKYYAVVTSQTAKLTSKKATLKVTGSTSSASASTSSTTRGIDVSKWQHEMTSSNMEAIDRWGGFVILRVGGSHVPIGKEVAHCGDTKKITQLQNVDCAYSGLVSKAKSAGLKVGHYWFNGWVSGSKGKDKDGKLNTPKDDAKYFVKKLKKYSKGDPLVLDIEDSSWNLKHWTPSQALEFLNEVDTQIQKKYGWKANLYVYMSAAETRDKDSNWSSVAKKSKLWVASWGSNNGKVPSSKPNIKYWDSWTIWQYTSNAKITGSGISRLDANLATTKAWSTPK